MTFTLMENKIGDNLKVERKYVIFDIKDITFKIYLDDIIFIEVVLRTCFVHTKHTIFEVNNISLKKIKEKFLDTNIVQCHRSFLVNIDNIIKIDKNKCNWEISFEGSNETIFVGEKYKKNLSVFYV